MSIALPIICVFFHLTPYLFRDILIRGDKRTFTFLDANHVTAEVYVLF